MKLGAVWLKDPEGTYKRIVDEANSLYEEGKLSLHERDSTIQIADECRAEANANNPKRS
jgi:hypothetical protein